MFGYNFIMLANFKFELKKVFFYVLMQESYHSNIEGNLFIYSLLQPRKFY